MEDELIRYIAENLVNHTDQIDIKVRRAGSSTKVIELRVASGDMGRVIGKQGRVANAMRSLLRVMGTRQDKRIILEID